MGDADDDSRKRQKRKMMEQKPQACSNEKDSNKELESTKSPWKSLRITASSYPEGVEAIREYECQECGKTFTRTQALGRHRRVHRPPSADIGVDNSNRGGADSNSEIPSLAESEITNKNVQLAHEEGEMGSESNIQETRKSKRKKLSNTKYLKDYVI